MGFPQSILIDRSWRHKTWWRKAWGQKNYIERISELFIWLYDKQINIFGLFLSEIEEEPSVINREYTFERREDVQSRYDCEDHMA